MTESTDRKVSRRTLLRVGGCAAISLVACGVTAGIVGTQTDILDRARGVTHTPLLANDGAWTFAGNVLTLNLDKIPELAKPLSAVRVEAEALPEPLLVVRDDDDYHVFINKCTHAGRKVDLKDGKLECTSLSVSTFDFEGTPQSGPAQGNLTSYTTELNGTELVVTLA